MTSNVTALRPRVAARSAADILTIGFGTTVFMWAVGYFSRLFELTIAAPHIVFALLCGAGALLAAAQLAGGFAMGALTTRGVRGGVFAGAVTGLINLLVVGAAVGGDQPNSIRPVAALLVPGSLAVAVLLAALGASIGARFRSRARTEPDWAGLFPTVVSAATFMLLAIGGVVTGADEGLAVVDWPNTETYNMFLFPLERMTGGVFFEHSHRLFGSLVGLASLVLAIHVQRRDSRRWVRLIAWIVLAMVVFQGILGGLRVTGRFTLSDRPEDTAPSIVLAIVHGVFGQLVFASLVALAVVRRRTWRMAGEPQPAPSLSTDRFFGLCLLIVLIAQLVLGALVRHFTWALRMFTRRYGLEADPAQLIADGQWALNIHITVAVVVALLVVAVGVRACGLYGGVAPLRALGANLLMLVLIQVILGVAAFIVTGDDSLNRRPSAFDVALTTLHQVIGAALLAFTVLLLLWSERRLSATAKHQRTTWTA